LYYQADEEVSQVHKLVHKILDRVSEKRGLEDQSQFPDEDLARCKAGSVQYF
jgi:hypothetical protein